MKPNLLRNIPSVSELIESPPLKGLVDRVSHNVVVNSVRNVLDDLRREVQQSAGESAIPPMGELAERIARRIVQGEQPALRPVINATGILLHTGLGRAPLADEAITALLEAAHGYASVELDLHSNLRSHRSQPAADLLRQLTGAEAALVVNNNAGGTLLTLAALAAGKEVIVSRGQLVEIGGSYRLPDVMAASGARLREVGTTNKTRLSDYRQALGPETAALMRVHTSNYQIVGFAESASLEELVRLAHAQQLPMIDDIGSGALLDFSRFGCAAEPDARRSLAAGADVVLFSGDKLLGGPQCGIVLGRRELIERLDQHPLARALRVDKLTLAALAATLRLYRDPEQALERIPLLQLLGVSAENLKNRAQRLAAQVAALPVVGAAEAVADQAELGGGAAPTYPLPTWCVAIAPAEGSADRLARLLRTGTPAVVGRIQRGKLYLDLRSVFAAQDAQLISALEAIPR